MATTLERRIAELEQRSRRGRRNAEQMSDAELWRLLFPAWNGPMPDDATLLRMLDERAAGVDPVIGHRPVAGVGGDDHDR